MVRPSLVGWGGGGWGVVGGLCLALCCRMPNCKKYVVSILRKSCPL